MESVCTGNRTKGSNPFLSAIHFGFAFIHVVEKGFSGAPSRFALGSSVEPTSVGCYSASAPLGRSMLIGNGGGVSRSTVHVCAQAPHRIVTTTSTAVFDVAERGRPSSAEQLGQRTGACQSGSVIGLLDGQRGKTPAVCA